MAEQISSRKNPFVTQLRKLNTDRAYRRSCGEYVCEGAKLYAEALKWGADVTAVLFCGPEPELRAGTRAVEAAPELLEAVSTLESAPDIIFTCRMPADDGEIAAGRHLVLENIQDPGNVGTMIRTANAFCMDSVILTGDSADPYGPKAVRASMGAVFRQRIVCVPAGELPELLGKSGIPLYATGLDASCTDLRETKLPASLALAIGNEGHGLSGLLLSACAHKITIPMSEMCESLNAASAAAVLMWEIFKRR